MQLPQRARSILTTIVVAVVAQCLLIGVTRTEESISKNDVEDMESHYQKYGLVVEIYPIDQVKMYEGGVVDVNLVIEANWTLLWNASHNSDDVNILPVWFRCPGIISVKSDDPSLLEVVNGTLNVTGPDFFNLNHTVSLRSYHQGPAFHYLQVHWTSTKPKEECGFVPDFYEVINEEVERDHHTTKRFLKSAQNPPSTTTISQPSNINETFIKNDHEETYFEHSTPEPVDTDGAVAIDEETEEPDMNSKDLPDAEKRVAVNEKPYASAGFGIQVFRRRRATGETDSEHHHHHHYDQSDVTIKVTASPTTTKVADLLLLDEYTVAVLRTPSTLDTAFVIVVTIAVAFNTFMMGMQVDLKIVLEVFKRPIGPAVGFVSQFLFMPLASYGLAHLLFSDINLQLGLFTLGCSPGGNGSNFWTLLLNGDLNLSITMTFVSTTCSIFMMPFWLYTLGQTILSRGKISIPFVNLILSLVSFTVPLSIGIVVRIFKPKWAAFARKLIRPITFLFIILVNIMAIANSVYIFRAMTWKTIVAGMGVAWGGFLFGGLLAFLCRQKRAQIIAISIETAIQNPGITFMVLRLTLDQPAADISAVAPVSQLIVTALPLLLLYVVIMLRRRIIQCRKNRRGMQTNEKPDGHADISKPLMMNNVISNADHGLPNDKLGNNSLAPPPPPKLPLPKVEIDDKSDAVEPMYENYPPGQRLTIVGESNV